MLNIVVPMAGRGSRFSDAGYELPKPLIDVHGYPMISWVIENIRPKTEHKFIFICQDEHIEQFSLDKLLPDLAGNTEVIGIRSVTEGAACTVLLAEDIINNDSALMIANSDQWVDLDINKYLAAVEHHDGLIMTMYADDPKWSFIDFNENGNIRGVIEKEVVSNEATVGIYNFTSGRDFCRYAHQMIDKELRVNGEFYVAPVYNELLADGAKIGYFNIGSVGKGMYGLGTPQDLQAFLIGPVKNKALASMRHLQK